MRSDLSWWEWKGNRSGWWRLGRHDPRRDPRIPWPAQTLVGQGRRDPVPRLENAMKTTILVGDCLKILRRIHDESVHCVITSPPYWGMRAYKGDPGMIGLEPTFEEHLENLVEVFREVRRVLRKDGTLWLNYGDAYAGGGRGVGSPGRESTGHAERGGLRGTFGFKPKDLMMMPARVAMALQADGWWLRSEIIWNKSNPMPESAEDRPTCSHEKLFLLSKSGSTLFWTHPFLPGVRTKPEPDCVYIHKIGPGVSVTRTEPEGWREDDNWRRKNLWRGRDYFYDAEAVKEPASGTAHARRSYKTVDSWDTSTGKGGHGKFHKDGREKGKRAPGVGVKATEPGTGIKQNESFQAAIVDIVQYRNLRNVWKISTSPYKEAHFATFPPKLVEPCIKAGTSEKGVCAECGSPWVREISKEFVPQPDVSIAKGVNGSFDQKPMGPDSGWDGFPRGSNRVTTTGWAPTCDHESDPVPAVCLDPFSGAGTVGLVAQRMIRDSILIEISQEYAEMARNRISKDMPLFAQVTIDSPQGIQIDETPGMLEMEVE